MIPWLAVGIGLAVGLLARAAFGGGRGALAAPGTYDFPFNDSAWLASGQNGGRAYVGTSVDSTSAPLVVWLHGNNNGGSLHRGLGGAGSAFDLRSKVPSNFIVAGPSQTRGASGGTLFSHFDLDAFVKEVEEATGTKVDRSRVYLVGHSGANCNVSGGTLSPLGVIKPRTIAIDGCLDDKYGRAYRERSQRVPVSVYYQTGTWSRDYEAFRKSFGNAGEFREITVPANVAYNAHEGIVPVVFDMLFG